MPHATECDTNLNNAASITLSSPIQIPISASTGYGRNSGSSSYSTSTVATLDDISDYICNPADNMNVGFDQSYQASSDEGSTYTPTITSDPVGRNLQPSYPRDYNCCGTDHQNLHDLLQHVDNFHPGILYTNGTAIPFEPYSQDRWNLMQMPVPSASTSLVTLTPNSSTQDQKNINFNPAVSYSILSSIPSNKQKGNVNNSGLGYPNGYNQSGIGQIDRFDQINDINRVTTVQSQDSLAYDNWMYLSLICDNNSTNPLRDPNFSSTLYGDQSLSSNPSSISTSLDDDNPFYDIPSKSLQDPFSPLLSIPSYPQTPNDYVEPSACLQSVASSPTSSGDNNSVVSPVANSSNINTSNNPQRSPITSNNDANSNVNAQQKCSITSNQQTSYGSVNNNINDNSRQRPISSSNNDAHSHVTAQQRQSSNLSAASHQLSSFDNVKIEQDTNKTLSMTQSTPKLISNQSVSPTMSNHQSYGPISGFMQATSIASNIDNSSNSQPRRSSTSTIIPSQSAAMSQNELQYRTLNMSNLGQGSISSSGNSVRPIVHLRRSSTSNLTPARTTAQTYGPLNISVEKSAYIPSVTTAQYSVDSYPIVSSGEASSGAVAPFSKFLPIQPKAGGVAMSDVYSDPALDGSGIKSSKKRTVSTSPVDIKSTKRRVAKSSDESESSVTVMPSDLSSEVESRSEGDIYPYKCVIPGCPKVYKNANGLKYHNEHGHASQSGNGTREKPWGCRIGGCLKTYSSKGGLIYHVKRCHPNDLWALP